WNHPGRSLGGLFLGSLLGMGSERSVGSYRALALSCRAPRQIRRLAERIRVRYGGGGFLSWRSDGLVRSEFRSRCWLAFLRFRYGRASLGAGLCMCSTRVRGRRLLAFSQNGRPLNDDFPEGNNSLNH